jgi:hypothetical protein
MTKALNDTLELILLLKRVDETMVGELVRTEQRLYALEDRVTAIEEQNKQASIEELQGVLIGLERRLSKQGVVIEIALKRLAGYEARIEMLEKQSQVMGPRLYEAETQISALNAWQEVTGNAIGNLTERMNAQEE